MRQPLSRASIADAARTILVNEGLQGVSLRKVAAGLGVTAPALYAHVIDKRDLLQTIAEQELQVLLKRFQEADLADPLDRAVTQARSYADWAAENPAVFRALFMFRPELTAESVGDEPPLSQRILDRFRETMREADFSPTTADSAAETLYAAVHGAIIVRLAGPAASDNSRLVDDVVSAVMAGLRRGDPVATG
ncbi:MAG: TetR/AcrR family transcriptional regulator [Acidimicrobiales bacterium]